MLTFGNTSAYSSGVDQVARPIMSFLFELWEFLHVRKKFWLMPVLLMMVLLGGLIVLANGSAIAPLIYTLFECRWAAVFLG